VSAHVAPWKCRYFAADAFPLTVDPLRTDTPNKPPIHQGKVNHIMTSSRHLRVAALAFSLTAMGALAACGSIVEGTGDAPSVPATTQADPKVGEHLAQAPTNTATTAPVHTCRASNCRTGPR
jgi:hypothetical protein